VDYIRMSCDHEDVTLSMHAVYLVMLHDKELVDLFESIELLWNFALLPD